MKIAQKINPFVFLTATLSIAAVFYEGITLKWYPAVTIFILIMDYSFLLSTIYNLITARKDKLMFPFSLFSLLLIIAALVLKITGTAYPPAALTLWYFYIWLYYGYIAFIRKNKKEEDHSCLQP